MDEERIRIAAGLALVLCLVMGFFLMQRAEKSRSLAHMMAQCVWDVYAVEERKVSWQWMLWTKLTFEYCFELGGWQSFFINLYFTKRHPDYAAIKGLVKGEKVRIVALAAPLPGMALYRTETYVRVSKVVEEVESVQPA